MTNIEFDLDIDGLRELMKSSEMQQILNETGSAVAANASGISGGESFDHAVRTADYTAIGTVFPETKEAAQATYQQNVLEKALSGLPRTKGG